MFSHGSCVPATCHERSLTETPDGARTIPAIALFRSLFVSIGLLINLGFGKEVRMHTERHSQGSTTPRKSNGPGFELIHALLKQLQPVRRQSEQRSQAIRRCRSDRESADRVF
jgi:hypothetical protein